MTLTCDKNDFFPNGDMLPRCFRNATQNVTITQGERSETRPVCDSCAALIKRMPLRKGMTKSFAERPVTAT